MIFMPPVSMSVIFVSRVSPIPPMAEFDGVTFNAKTRLVCVVRSPRPRVTARPKTPPNNRLNKTKILIQEIRRLGRRGGFLGGVLRTLIRAGGVEPARDLYTTGTAGGVTGIGATRGVLWVTTFSQFARRCNSSTITSCSLIRG